MLPASSTQMAPSSSQQLQAHPTASGESSLQIFHICIFIIYPTTLSPLYSCLRDPSISWPLLGGLGLQVSPSHSRTPPPAKWSPSSEAPSLRPSPLVFPALRLGGALAGVASLYPSLLLLPSPCLINLRPRYQFLMLNVLFQLMHGFCLSTGPSWHT